MHARLLLSCLRLTCQDSLGSRLLNRPVHGGHRTSPTGLSAATTIGRYVTIGQGCVLRSTSVRGNCIIGDRSILMEGSLVEEGSILAPGTILPPGRLVPKGQLWAGNPARYVRDLSNDEVWKPFPIMIGCSSARYSSTRLHPLPRLDYQSSCPGTFAVVVTVPLPCPFSCASRPHSPQTSLLAVPKSVVTMLIIRCNKAAFLLPQARSAITYAMLWVPCPGMSCT